MKNTRWIFLLFFCFSCSNMSSIKSDTDEPSKKLVNNESLSPVEVDVFNGKIKYIEFKLTESEQKKNSELLILCEEQNSPKPLISKIPFLKDGTDAKLYYAEGYLSSAKSHYCYFGERLVFIVNVKIYPYKEEFLNVDQKRVVLSKKDQERANREWHLVQKIYQNAYKGSYINAPFIPPLNSFITSRYGKRRVFNKIKKTQHLGNDFRAKVGVPIPASNRGKVVFSGNLFYTGNVVIVDHGLGIFSLYGHLSKNFVKVDDIIEQGEILGLSGRTGRVSGPHLHWGVKMHGHNVDGFSLVDESKRQFVKDNDKAY